jgi:hypothetical protein
LLGRQQQQLLVLLALLVPGVLLLLHSLLPFTISWQQRMLHRWCIPLPPSRLRHHMVMVQHRIIRQRSMAWHDAVAAACPAALCS